MLLVFLAKDSEVTIMGGSLGRNKRITEKVASAPIRCNNSSMAGRPPKTEVALAFLQLSFDHRSNRCA